MDGGKLGMAYGSEKTMAFAAGNSDGTGYVFISYSSTDRQKADRTRRVLEKSGITCWMAPNDIPAGSKYAFVINDALENCSCLLLLLSKASQRSQFVEKELERAIAYRKPIVTMQLEDMELNSGFKFYIGDGQIVQVHNIELNSGEMKRVIKGVRSFTRRPGGLTMTLRLYMDERKKKTRPAEEKKGAKAFLASMPRRRIAVAAVAGVVMIGGGIWLTEQNTTVFSSAMVRGDGLRYKVKGNGDVVLSGYLGERDYVVLPKSFDVRVERGRGFPRDLLICSYATLPELSYGNDPVGDGIILDSYLGSESVVALPPEINGRGVTGIGEHFLQGSNAVTRVILPDGIRKIGDYAFGDTPSLKKINLPEGLGQIGAYVFLGSSIAELTVPSTLEDCGEGSFAGVGGIRVAEGNQNYVLEDGTLVYRDGSTECRIVWVDPEKTGEYSIPDDVTAVGSAAFYGIGLSSVSLPGSLGEIAPRLFQNAQALEKVEIGEGISEIGARAFQGCTALTEVALPSSVTKVGTQAFQGCTGLKTVHISRGCAVEEGAFEESVEVQYYSTVSSGNSGRPYMEEAAGQKPGLIQSDE